MGPRITPSRSPTVIPFLLRVLLRLYPRSFRVEYGEQVEDVVCRRVRSARVNRGRLAAMRVLLHHLTDIIRGAWSESVEDTQRRRSTKRPRGDGMLATTLQDVRYTFRMMRQRPGFTAAVLLTLTLGIGTSTTVFSVADTLMFRELPYPDADELVTVWRNNHTEGIPREDVSPADFLDWRERSELFQVLAAANPYSMDLTSEGPPETLYGVQVTEGFFDALGVLPQVGRLFRPDDHVGGAGGVVVLTHGLWQRRFGLDTEIVGRTLTLDGVPRVVVGVLPPDFELGILPAAGERGLWAPYSLQGWERNARGSGWWNVIGRVKSGVTLSQAQDELDRISSALATEYPATNAATGATIVPFREHLVGSARPALFMLMGAVGVVLLIACANVAGLLLARGVDREAEFVLRAALGAERGRLLRQLFAESLVFALLGAGLGLAVAYWGMELIRAITPGDIPRIEQVSVDLRVLVSALAIGVGAAVVFGLVPATQFSKPRVRDALSETRASPGGRNQKLRAVFIVVEMALAVTLLIGAGLLLRSFIAIINVDPGFQRENLLAFQVFAYDDEKTAQDRMAFFAETIERIEGLSAVESAGAVSAAPFLEADLAIRRPFTWEGASEPAAGASNQVYVVSATEGYFSTVSIALITGRFFTSFDRVGAAPVAVINQAMKRLYWPNEDALGHRLLFGNSPPIEIVGIVGDVRHEGLDAEPRPEVFLPHRQTGAGGMTYFVRARGDVATTIDLVQREVWAVEPLQAFYRTATMDELFSNTLKPRRFTMFLLAGFAAMALLMAAIGVYGVISFHVTSRTHEMGVRMALGASRDALLGGIVLRGLTLCAMGLSLGLVGGWFASRAIASFLFGVSPADAVTFVVTAVVIVSVAGFSSYIPAHRITRVDPAVALRYE